VPDILLETINAMTTRTAFYRRAPAITTREGQRLNTIVIWPPERARSGSYSDCFDPMWCLTGYMTKCLDDLVNLQVGDEALLNRHTVDLSRGGNVVKYYAASDDGTELRKWTYEQHIVVAECFGIDELGDKFKRNN